MFSKLCECEGQVFSGDKLVPSPHLQDAAGSVPGPQGEASGCVTLHRHRGEPGGQTSLGGWRGVAMLSVQPESDPASKNGQGGLLQKHCF